MIMVYYDYILHIITIYIVYINIMLSFQIKSQILSPHVKAPDKAAPGMVDSSSIQISCVVFFVECFANNHNIVFTLHERQFSRRREGLS